MSDTPQYGENGFVPTINNIKWEGDNIVMETIDEREETDLVGKRGEPLQRRGDLVTDEQKEKLALREG